MNRDTWPRVQSGIRRFLSAERAALETVVVSFLTALAGFAGGIVLAHTLGPVGRGRVAAHLVGVGASFALGSLGINYGAALAASRTGGSSQAFRKIMPLAAASLWLTFVLDLLIELVVVRPGRPGELTWSLLASVFTQGASISLGWLQGSGTLRTWNSLRLLQLGAFFPLVLVFEGLDALGVTAAVAAYALPQLVAAVIAVVLIHRPSHRGAATRLISWKEIWAYSRQVAVSAALYQVNQRWDQLLLSFLRRTADLGVYASAVTVAQLGVPVGTGLSQATYAEGLQVPGEQRWRLSRRRIAVAVASAGVLALGLSVFCRALMRGIYGPFFARGAGALALLSWGTVSLAGSMVAAESLRAAGNARIPMYADTVGALTTVVLLPFAVERFGILGAATVSTLSYSVTFACNSFFALRILESPKSPLEEPRW